MISFFPSLFFSGRIKEGKKRVACVQWVAECAGRHSEIQKKTKKGGWFVMHTVHGLGREPDCQTKVSVKEYLHPMYGATEGHDRMRIRRKKYREREKDRGHVGTLGCRFIDQEPTWSTPDDVVVTPIHRASPAHMRIRGRKRRRTSKELVVVFVYPAARLDSFDILWWRMKGGNWRG